MDLTLPMSIKAIVYANQVSLHAEGSYPDETPAKTR